MALTKIKGAGINISAAEKLYFDGGGTTYIQESADGVLDFYADNVKMLELLEGGTDYVWVPVDATKLAIGAGKDLNIYTSSDDAIIENITSDKDIIFKGNDGGGTITALTLDISAAGAATFNDKIIATELDISGNMDIDGTSNLDAVDIDGAVQIDNTVTVGADDPGYDVIFYGDTASSNMTWDTSADDLILNDATLSIVQDDAQYGISIDQNGNNTALYIDSESTTEAALQINADALTTEKIAYFYSNSASTGARKLVEIRNDNPLATGATCLYINQDANTYGFYMDAENTTGTAFEIGSDVVTSGKIAQFYSNSDDNTARNLVEIGNDHTSADNAVCLYIKQDGADASIELGGNGSIKFPGTQGASSDANSLDDYEEGTWTGAFVGTSSSTPLTMGSATGTYVKVGGVVHCCGYFSVSSLNGQSGNLKLTGLPFSIPDNTRNYGSVCVGYGSNLNITAQDSLTGHFIPNSTEVQLSIWTSSAGTDGFAASQLSADGSIMVNFSYFVI